MSDYTPFGSDDPRWFAQTSDGIYDRHHYKVIFKDGQEQMFGSWEEAYATWFQWNRMRVIDRIEVCDIKKPKVRKPKPKGF